METAHLREYIFFAQSMSYSKAAKELFISEPTLRSHIKSLEDEVGSPLFIRQDGRLELSLAGKLYLKNAREIVQLIESTLTDCRNISCNSTLILAGTLGYPLFEELLASAREHLRKTHPDVVIDLRFANSIHANIATITDRKADITLLPRLRRAEEKCSASSIPLPSELDALYLKSEDCMFWMTNQNPLYDKDTIDISDLHGQSLLLGNTDNMISAGEKFSDYFKEENVDIGIDHQPFSSYNDYVFSAYNGFGMFIESLHPSFRSHADRRAFLVKEFPLRFDIYIIFNRDVFDDIGLLYLQQLTAFLSEAA